MGGTRFEKLVSETIDVGAARVRIFGLKSPDVVTFDDESAAVEILVVESLFVVTFGPSSISRSGMFSIEPSSITIFDENSSTVRIFRGQSLIDELLGVTGMLEVGTFASDKSNIKLSRVESLGIGTVVTKSAVIWIFDVRSFLPSGEIILLTVDTIGIEASTLEMFSIGLDVIEMLDAMSLLFVTFGVIGMFDVESEGIRTFDDEMSVIAIFKLRSFFSAPFGDIRKLGVGTLGLEKSSIRLLNGESLDIGTSDPRSTFMGIFIVKW